MEGVSERLVMKRLYVSESQHITTPPPPKIGAENVKRNTENGNSYVGRLSYFRT